jgi:hypothetical protein
MHFHLSRAHTDLERTKNTTGPEGSFEFRVVLHV